MGNNVTPQAEFSFHPEVAPEIVEQLGLRSVESARIEEHPEKILEEDSFPDVSEYKLVIKKQGESNWSVVPDLRIIFTNGYWVVSYKGFIYIEVLPGVGDLSGVIDLARVQAKMTHEVFERDVNAEGETKVFLPHWSLVNYSGIPRPSAGTVVAGIIAAAHRVLRGSRTGLLICQGFCETDRMLLSDRSPKIEDRKSIKNFIRLGSNMDRVFINPLEHATDPKSALEYLKRKYVEKLENFK